RASALQGPHALPEPHLPPNRATAPCWKGACSASPRAEVCASRGIAPSRACPRRLPSVEKPMVGALASPAREVPVTPLPLTGQERGIGLGRESFDTRADGQHIENARHAGKGQRSRRFSQR